MAAPLYTTASGQLYHAGKILIATVGLPARGKTHLSHALERYLKWLGVKCGVFSLGDYRRKVLGGADRVPSDYFRPGEKSEDTEALRARILAEFDQQVADFFLKEGGQVIIYDANNGTQKRRFDIREKFGAMGVHVMFLESICTDQKIVEENIRSVKISSPDYKSWNPEKAIEDFQKRIKSHEAFYEPIEQPSFPYIKVINVGQKIVVNNIQGYLQSRVVFFLMNIHNKQRTIYLARAGEALIEHLYKADADLSSLGWEYADKLCETMEDRRNKLAQKSIEKAESGNSTPGGYAPGSGPGEAGRPLEIWTSARRRSSHTALPFADRGYRVIERSQLSEMNPGVVDGMSVDEVKARFPDEWDKKLKEPYSHRFPRAESYHDLSVRLEIIIFELERATDDVLIIGQSSVLRCLIAYLQGRKPNEIPMIHVHEGELLEISPQAYGVNTKVIKFWDPIGKRKERDEAYFRGKEAANASGAHGDVTISDLSKFPLQILEQQFHNQSSDDAKVAAAIGHRASSPTSSSSSTAAGDDMMATTTDATAPSPGEADKESFKQLNIEEYDKLSASEKETYDRTKAERETLEQSKLPYKWDQTLEAVTLTVGLPTGTRGKDLKVTIKKNSLSIVTKADAKAIIQDALFNGIKEEDSTWSLSDGNLDIHLEKLQKDQWWPHVLVKDPKIDTTKIVPENSKLSDLDGETRAMVEKMMFDNRQKQMGKPTSDQVKQNTALETFKEQHPEMDFSNVKMS
ncbi:hypothetical protein CBS101457_004287 [Exobasidium rhododendri]|nr:hypothetical protein CBS101457_004287 [Exobasidium rhododendri]